MFVHYYLDKTLKHHPCLFAGSDKTTEMIFKKNINSKEVSHQNLLHQNNLLKTSPTICQNSTNKKDMSPGHWNYSLEALKAPLANAFGSFPGTVLDAWAQCGQWGIRCAKAGAKDAGMENSVEKRGESPVG